MPEIGSVVQSAMDNGPGIVGIIITILVGVIIFLIIGGGIFFIWYKYRRFNLKIEIKKPRNDGRLIIADIGRGIYDAGKGVIYIKTPQSNKTIPMKIFDTKRYLQGTNLISVIQIGPSDFRPILNDTCNIEENKHGIKEATLNIKIEQENNKAWMVEFERASKNAFSLKNFIQNNQSIVAICVVIICSFMGFVSLYAKMASSAVI